MSSDDQDADKGLSFSSNLYLFTFLSTLVLLIAISALIIFRSLIVRRRIHRTINEALQHGLILPLNSPSEKRKEPWQRPRLYESWIADGGDLWDEMMPICGQVVKRKKSVADSTKAFVPPGPRPRTLGLLSRLRGHSPPSPSPSPTEACCTPRAVETALRNARMIEPIANVCKHSELSNTDEMLQVAVFISMPCPRDAQSSDKASPTSAALPELAVGIRRFAMIRSCATPH